MSGFSAFNKTVKFQVKWTAELLPTAKIVLINIFQIFFKIPVKKDGLYSMAWIFKGWCLQGILRITERRSSVRTSFTFLVNLIILCSTCFRGGVYSDTTFGCKRFLKTQPQAPAVWKCLAIEPILLKLHLAEIYLFQHGAVSSFSESSSKQGLSLASWVPCFDAKEGLWISGWQKFCLLLKENVQKMKNKTTELQALLKASYFPMRISSHLKHIDTEWV